MEFMTGKKEKEVLGLAQILTEVSEGQEIKVNGAVHSVRDMGEIAFVILRKREGLLQTVFEKGKTEADFSQLREETFVEVTGTLEKEERAPHGVELRLTAVKILSKPEEPMPIAVSKWKMGASLEARLDMRPLTLRNVRERARFKIQEGIARAFREYLQKEGFTEIHSPKIGAKGAEGNAQAGEDSGRKQIPVCRRDPGQPVSKGFFGSKHKENNLSMVLFLTVYHRIGGFGNMENAITLEW